MIGMIRRGAAKIFVCVLAGAAVCAVAQKPASVPVFVSGAEGYKCYRIPAIVKTPDGALMAFAEARRNSCSDFGDVSIVLRISVDGGLTWGPMSTAASNGALQAGNPTPIVDILDRRYPKGRVLLLYETGNATEADVREGKGERRIWMQTTVDDGRTWSKAVDITGGTKAASWRAYGTGPGHGLLLTGGPHKGRIVVGAYHSEGAAQYDSHDYAAHIIFSDDHGKTWRRGATLQVPGSNESTVAQRSDGTVVMNSRDETGATPARIISIGKYGRAQWDEVHVAHDLPDPKCEGSMIAYRDKKGWLWLLFSNSGSGVLGKRENLTVSVSSDGGKTWPSHTVLYAGPAAYSDIVLMGNDQLGVLWESADQHGIVFLTHPIKPLLSQFDGR